MLSLPFLPHRCVVASNYPEAMRANRHGPYRERTSHMSNSGREAHRTHREQLTGSMTAWRHPDDRSRRRPLSPTMMVEPSWPATPSGSGGRCPNRSQITRTEMNAAAMARLAENPRA